MENKSIFRAFITSLRKKWKTELPSVHPLTETRGHVPKASSFYAGMVRDTDMHVLLNFQHSPKSWQVGQFTINIVFASDEYQPKMYSVRRSGRLFCFEDGYERIGSLVWSRDKWWHLKEDDDPISTLAWRPSSYQNNDLVIAEAVGDVTKDVLCALEMLNVPFERLNPGPQEDGSRTRMGR